MSLAHPGPSLTPSYFDATITNGGLLDGFYDDWCVDTSRTINTGQVYTVDVYSSYSNSLPSGLVDMPQNLDLVNWIINQGYVGQTAPNSLGTYTYGDEQRAIWTLITNTNSTAGLGTYSQDRVDLIVAQATAFGEGFRPGPGQYMAVIFRPVDSNDATIAQVTFGVVPLPGTYTNTATATGDYNTMTVTDTDPHTTQILGNVTVGDFVWEDRMATASRTAARPASAASH